MANEPKEWKARREKRRELAEMCRSIGEKLGGPLLQDAAAELEYLDDLINHPKTDDFLDAVRLEAAHQGDRWAEYDGEKSAEDWVALIRWLSSKAKAAETEEKRRHHIITTAAACLSWFRQLEGAYGERPSISLGDPLHHCPTCGEEVYPGEEVWVEHPLAPEPFCSREHAQEWIKARWPETEKPVPDCPGCGLPTAEVDLSFDGYCSPECRDTITLTQEEFDKLREYSCSLPTGTTIGKRWKRNQNAFAPGDNEPDWWMGEYVEHEDPDAVGTRYRKIEIEEGEQ